MFFYLVFCSINDRGFYDRWDCVILSLVNFILDIIVVYVVRFVFFV